jgi:lauroyl/myristoyl acyltransferase
VSQVKQSLNDSLIVGAYKFGSLLSRIVPNAATGVVSSAISWPAFWSSSDKRMMVERHMRRVSPQANQAEIRKMARDVFQSYAHYYLESFRLPSRTADKVAATTSIDGYTENLLPALDKGNGAIFALPHLGGWEWMGRWAVDTGIKMTVVVEAIQPPALFEWFADLRRKFGMTVIPLGPSAGTQVLRALRNNEVVCLLSDRDLTGGGIPVKFFGETTTLPAGPATLALRTGAALLPTAAFFTDRNLGHHGIIGAPMECERHGRLRPDVSRITQNLAHELEALIRKAPSQWHLLQPNWPSDPGYPHQIRNEPNTADDEA